MVLIYSPLSFRWAGPVGLLVRENWLFLACLTSSRTAFEVNVWRLLLSFMAGRSGLTRSELRGYRTAAHANCHLLTRVAQYYLPLPGPGTVRVAPFLAKISARSFAGSVLLAFFETSCVAPGAS